jgi:tetratricopeptide (TPR) repeat protein
VPLLLKPRDLTRTLTRVPGAGAAAQAREAYLQACRRLDANPAEQRRIDDIAGQLDAEETLYARARAAADHGDTATAIPMLRQCAEVGTGEAAWLLAQLLQEAGDTAEAMVWYQRAADDGDGRAADKLTELRAVTASAASDMAAIVRRAAEGDVRAWERLVDQYARIIWSGA